MESREYFGFKMFFTELSYNLLNVPKAMVKGVAITFNDSKCRIFDKKERQIA